MKNFFKIALSFGVLVIGVAHANSLPSPQDTEEQMMYDAPYAPPHQLAHYAMFDDSTPHVTLYLTGGVTFSNLENNTNVTVDPYGDINSYYTDTQWNALAGVGLGVGYITYPYPFEHFRIAVMPAFYYADFGTLSGTEYPDSNGGGPFDTLNYQFDGYSLALMAEAHFSYTAYSWQPVLVLGIGAADDTLKSYSETATDPNSGASSTNYPFSNNSIFQFAYEVGVGVEHPIFVGYSKTTAFTVGLQYRYFNFGNGELGTNGQTSDHLSVKPMSAQAILGTLGMSFA